jgi:hypothetical protein
MLRKKHLMLGKIAFSIMATAALAVWAAGAAGPAAAATGWALQSTPYTAEPVASLTGVSCVSASDCEAVGSTSGGTLAEEWNGSSWTIQSTPGASPDDLSSVSCLSASDCMAVGGISGGSLAEEWNGSSWTALSAPGHGLSGVSCLSASDCEAVGESSSGVAGADYWNGSTWTAQSVSGGSGLQSVSCFSASNCMAVGFGGSTGTSGYSEHWNGSSWSAENFVVQGSFTWPMSVSCGSASSCLATGVYYSTGATFEYALAEYWNGSSWTVENGQSPNDQAFLAGVACVSGSNCTAVGLYNANSSDTGVNLSLAESWNGSSWTVESTPNPSGEEADNLLSVSCPSTTDCSATGAWSGSDLSDAEAYAEQWTG